MSSTSKNCLSYRRYVKKITIGEGNKNSKQLKKLFSDKNRDKLSFVETIAFGRNTCTQKIMKMIFNKNVFSRLCELDFCATNLTDKTLDYIDFSYIPNIHTIDLSCNKKITSVGFINFLGKIKYYKHKRIHTFHINFSRIDKDGFNHFVDMIPEYFCNLCNLDLSYCRIDDSWPNRGLKLTEFMTNIRFITKIQALFLDNIFFSYDSILSVSKAFTDKCFINLEFFGIGVEDYDDCLKILIDSMCKTTCPKLDALRLTKRNQQPFIGHDSGITALFEKLRDKGSLKLSELDIEGYIFETESIEFLSKIVNPLHFHQLRSLDFYFFDWKENYHMLIENLKVFKETLKEKNLKHIKCRLNISTRCSTPTLRRLFSEIQAEFNKQGVKIELY